MSKGRVIIISGPSGVGKKTIIDKFINVKKFNLKTSVSATTRIPRSGEINGVDYYFLTHEDFNNKINNGEFLEWAEFAGNKYGTLLSEVERIKKDSNLILEIEVQGATEIMKKNNVDNLLTFFIIPPSIEELENRLRKRNTETEEKIKLRLSKARHEMELSSKYSYVIVNDDADKAAKEFVKILEKELCEK